MGFELQLTTFGEVTLHRELVRTSMRAQDMSPVLHTLADDFLNVERYQFASEGKLSGGWAPLAPSTVAHKAARGLDPRRLHATLALVHSLTRKADPHHVRRISPDEMFVGSSVVSEKGFPYPVAHQHGTGRIPRRRVVEFSETRKRIWMKRLQRYIVEGTIQ